MKRRRLGSTDARVRLRTKVARAGRTMDTCPTDHRDKCGYPLMAGFGPGAFAMALQPGAAFSILTVASD